MIEEQIQRMTIYFPPDLLEKVRESAKKHRRSFNGEALCLMEQSLENVNETKKMNVKENQDEQ